MSQVISGIVTIQNEHVQVIQQWGGAKKLSDLIPLMKEHFASYKTLGLKEPLVIYVDDGEQSELILLECYPSIRPENDGFGMYFIVYYKEELAINIPLN